MAMTLGWVQAMAGSTLAQVIDELRKTGLSDKTICDGALAATVDLMHGGRFHPDRAAQLTSGALTRFDLNQGDDDAVRSALPGVL